MKKLLSILLLALALFTSCDKFLDVQPVGKVIAKTGEEYRALLTGVYNNFPDDRSLTFLRTDEIIMDQTAQAEDINSYFDIWTWNDMTPDENTVSCNWRRFYHTCYIASYIIEHQSEITEAKPAEVRQMVGEAYMLRAYSHYVLVNLFGEPYTKCNPQTAPAVPLINRADVEQVLGRNTVAEVYDQILSDIAAAEQFLNVEKWDADYSYRFNVISAKALRARVCLYMGRWQEAYDAAMAVVKARPELEDLSQNAGFQMPDHYQSVEAIVSLEKVMKLEYKRIGLPNVAFINAFRSGDMRKSRFFKAKTSRIWDLLKGKATDETIDRRSTFRTSEFYLTAAEAAAQMGNLQDAIDIITPLNANRYAAVMATRVSTEMAAMDKQQMIDFVLEERRKELCYEGHRWFDLRRTTQPELTREFDGVTYTLSQGDSRYTLQLPKEAISANPNLEAE